MNAEEADQVNVALGIDRGYAPHAAAVIASLVRNAPDARFAFLILHVGVEPALQARVEAVAPEAAFIWREIGDDDVPAMADREHFSRAILFRLGIEKHAPADWRRLVYVDADVIGAGDIRELWRCELAGSPIGAVIDCYVDGDAFAARWGLPRAGGYFNSGVLLIDLERVRAEGLFARAIDFAVAHIAELRFTDQDALNHACWGRWTRLDPRWNVQRHMVIPALIEEIAEDKRLGQAAPAIIHYTGPEKPWLRQGYHPWSWLYWDSLQRTPFFAEVARAHDMGPLRRLMLWQRWMRRRA